VRVLNQIITPTADTRELRLDCGIETLGKTKICFITTLPITLWLFVRPQAEYLLRNGWEVTWVCSEKADFVNDLPKGLRYLPLPIKRGIDPFGLPRALLQLYKIFKRENFDIIQYSTPNAAFYASTAAWFARVPVRVYAQWGIRYVGFTGAVRKIFKLIELWCCRCSTIIEPDSFSNLEFSITEGLYPREKCRVIWNGSASGVDLRHFNIAHKQRWRSEYRNKFGCDSQHIIIGFVGSIRQDKGCNELLYACRSFFDENPLLRLLLIGDKHFYSDLNKDLRDWAESSKQVVYIPPNQEIPQYMACMDIFAFPSYREGFGLSVIEAEAMGVPVVVSDVPGPIDAMLHEKTGLMIPVKNTNALSIALKTLLNDTAKRTTYSVAAAEFVLNNFEQNEFLRRVLEDKIQLITERY
jgi:glycosyltransferase involved in cell wall biosynthesis